jgi:AraC-like DNA-binding protein
VYVLTIYAYIQKLRLEKANILLKEDSLSIGEIAKKVGYKHQGHFSKLFFESYGIYPKELIKVRYC